MDTIPGQFPEASRGEGLRPVLAVATALIVLAGLVLAIFFPPVTGPRTGVPASRKVSELAVPVEIVSELVQPIGEEWLLPAGVTRLGDSTFVLDTANNRLLRLDASGRVLQIIGPDLGNAEFQQPMAIATDGQRLFIANSLAGEILIVESSGSFDGSITLQAPPGGSVPRPIGIVASGGGRLVISDANNHRVLFMDINGTVLASTGTGRRSIGEDGFNVPSGLAVDVLGNVYVVDTLNGRVVKLSPEGEYLGEFARLADTAGSLARPKGVAVDASGRIFVSDGLQAAIEVFGPDGSYLGMIGRRDINQTISDSIFEAPSALYLEDDTLYVMDAIAGLITLRLLPDASAGESLP
jgi:sugar lactone lactonase YvrE